MCANACALLATISSHFKGGLTSCRGRQGTMLHTVGLMRSKRVEGSPRMLQPLCLARPTGQWAGMLCGTGWWHLLRPLAVDHTNHHANVLEGTDGNLPPRAPSPSLLFTPPAASRETVCAGTAASLSLLTCA